MRDRLARGVLTVGVVGVLGHAASGDIIAAEYLGGGIERNFDFAAGWFFTPTSDLLVTQLGMLDLGDPGLVDQHDVGIFRAADGALMVMASIGPGLGGEGVNDSLFVDVSETFLNGGEQFYILVNNLQNDMYAFGDDAVTFAPEIQWQGQGGTVVNDIFADMRNLGGSPGNLGANFQYVVVPAPASGFVLTGIGLAWVRRRR